MKINRFTTLALAPNIIFLSVLAWWHLTARAGPAAPTRRAAGTVASAGFTLIEALVCLTIVTILSTLALAALGAARQRSKQAGVSTLLRQHAAVMTLYAGDHKDCLPYVTRPAPEPTIIVTAAADRPVELLYFSAFFGWSAGLADGYYDGQYRAGPFRSPFWRNHASGEFSTGINDFFYPCTFLAAPDYWNVQTRLVPVAQLTPTRSSMVTFPSRKSLVVHDVAHHAPSFAAALVDGHAATLADRTIGPEVNDDGYSYRREFGGHRGVGGPRMLHTFRGSKGTDLP